MKFYGTIEKAEKQSDGTMHVSGYASSESVDGDGEVIKAAAIKAAIPDFMKWANVREMHQAKAAGTVLEMVTNDDGKTWVKTHIVDTEACKKVEHNVYKGFSVGGRVTERDEADPKIIKGISLSEISLVDRPSNPDAVFLIYKMQDDEAVKKAKEIADAKKAEEDEAAKAKDAKELSEKISDMVKAELEKAGARHNAGDRKSLETLSEHIKNTSDHHEETGNSLQECHKCMKALGLGGHDEYIEGDKEGS